jgi:hypothetical protein
MPSWAAFATPPNGGDRQQNLAGVDAAKQGDEQGIDLIAVVDPVDRMERYRRIATTMMLL